MTLKNALLYLFMQFLQTYFYISNKLTASDPNRGRSAEV